MKTAQILVSLFVFVAFAGNASSQATTEQLNKLYGQLKKSTLKALKDKEITAVEFKTNKEWVEFLDNMDKYKGKVIKMRLEYDAKSPLRAGKGANTPFRKGNVSIWMWVIKPKKITDLPNARAGDKLDVLFMCNGNLKNGNLAISIKR